jgi:large subunit ribosomal protein L13
MSANISHLLLGKHKPHFSKHLDVGDYVVVTNLRKVVLTGKKWTQKEYYYHTRWPGGLKVTFCIEINH